MKHPTWHLCVCTLLAVSSPVFAGQTPDAVAAPAAGRVRVLAGSATIVRGNDTIAARLGLAVLEGDVLRTGADGELGVTLIDDTRVSLGPDSAIRIDAVQYAPEKGKLALALGVVRGVAAYVSGRIAKLAPDAVRLETPAAIVGVRGTTLVIQVAED